MVQVVEVDQSAACVRASRQ